jgi:hypothetical protein
VNKKCSNQDLQNVIQRDLLEIGLESCNEDKF